MNKITSIFLFSIFLVGPLACAPPTKRMLAPSKDASGGSDTAKTGTGGATGNGGATGDGGASGDGGAGMGGAGMGGAGMGGAGMGGAGLPDAAPMFVDAGTDATGGVTDAGVPDTATVADAVIDTAADTVDAATATADAAADVAADMAADMAADVSSDATADAPPAIDPTGLWGYWTMDEGTGTTAADSSGNAHNGTLTLGPAWVAGKRGAHALDFDGVNDALDVGYGFNPGVADFTVCAYVKTTATGNIAAFHKAEYAGSGNGFVFGLSAGHLNFTVFPGGQKTDTGSTVNDGAWHHIAMVKKAGVSTRFYVDGIFTSDGGADSTDVSSAGGNSVALLVGGGTIYGPAPFQGSIDEARVYNRALTDAEILSASAQ